MWQAICFALLFSPWPLIACRLAAKQAVQVCCKASNTGLLQSKWACCRTMKQFPAEQASLLLKISISVWGSVWRTICAMWAIMRHISGELTLPLATSWIRCSEPCQSGSVQAQAQREVSSPGCSLRPMDGARKIPEEEAMDNSLQKIDQYTEEEAQRRFLQTIIHHTAVARAEAQGVDCCLVHLGSLLFVCLIKLFHMVVISRLICWCTVWLLF